MLGSMLCRVLPGLIAAGAILVSAGLSARAQTPPSSEEIAAYTDLHAAVVRGSLSEIERAVRDGSDINARDGFGRTPLMVAAYRRDIAVARALIELGANVNALEYRSYDVITIAAVLNDLEMLKLAIEFNGNTRAITSPYGGTALIAAAHLGHVEMVEALIAARVPFITSTTTSAGPPCWKPSCSRRLAPPGHGGNHQRRRLVSCSSASREGATPIAGQIEGLCRYRAPPRAGWRIVECAGDKE